MCVWHRSAEVLCVGKVLSDWANVSAVKHFESSLRLRLVVVVKVRKALIHFNFSVSTYSSIVFFSSGVSTVHFSCIAASVQRVCDVVITALCRGRRSKTAG